MAILTSKGARAPHQLKGRRNVRISRDRRGCGNDDIEQLKDEVNKALKVYKKIDYKVVKNNEQILNISSSYPLLSILGNDGSTSVLFYVSPWAQGYSIISGTLPSHLTIKHSQYSYEVSIASTHPTYEYYCTTI